LGSSADAKDDNPWSVAHGASQREIARATAGGLCEAERQLVSRHFDLDQQLVRGE
jgi:hypothetical protein